jgi:hypothetical protein
LLQAQTRKRSQVRVLPPTTKHSGNPRRFGAFRGSSIVTNLQRYTTEKAGMSIQQNPKYPDQKQIIAWENEWDETPGGMSLTAYVARAACSWQREQDALIAQRHPTPACCNRIEQELWKVAQHVMSDAIRSGETK